ncbi:MAG: pyridoxal phosphate-dependent aminotransferase [Clostridia bacterium]|nr:pyridoxal phosphate-dependent aminotransferase [Clostridia bacterium]
MKELSIAAKRVTPSPIREMFNKALGMQDVVSFTVGEPDFSTPEHIVKAAAEALYRGEHKYTPNAGILPLRQAICERTAQTHGLSYDPEKQAIVTAGGMEALMLTMMVLLNPGDEFIVSDPSWTNYSRQVLLCSAEPVFVPVFADNNFTLDADRLEAAITDKTKGFLVNSPANPTGGIASRQALEKLAEIAVRHDLWVISDEVYSALVYEGESVTSIATLPGMQERTIIVNSFSKTYAMTGWRVGWALGPADVIGNMVKLQENVAACVNSSAQYGALEALRADQTPVQMMVDTYSRRRKLITEEFAKIPGLKCFAPQGAFYAFVDVSQTGMDARTFAMELLEKARVIVVPGTAFGQSSGQYIRLSFATSEQTILEGTRRIRAFMREREEGRR